MVVLKPILEPLMLDKRLACLKFECFRPRECFFAAIRKKRGEFLGVLMRRFAEGLFCDIAHAIGDHN